MDHLHCLVAVAVAWVEAEECTLDRMILFSEIDSALAVALAWVLLHKDHGVEMDSYHLVQSHLELDSIPSDHSELDLDLDHEAHSDQMEGCYHQELDLHRIKDKVILIGMMSGLLVATATTITCSCEGMSTVGSVSMQQASK